MTSFAALDENDRYIEPNETIEMQRLISIPGALKTAFRLELEIVSKNGYIWHATTIVDKSGLQDNKPAKLISVRSTIRNKDRKNTALLLSNWNVMSENKWFSENGTNRLKTK